MTNVRYIIITPARNEGKYIQKTIESIVSQTLHPERWIIVDDGSADNTGRIIEEAARQHSWIMVLHRADRGFRRAGGGVMEAFYEAYKLIEDEPWQFLVKLDGDLSFGPHYFEKCFEVFRVEPRLGIGGGLVCANLNERIDEEFRDPAFHVRGPTKIYRRECWQEIGGLIRMTGWDTFDGIKANMLGWSTRTFPDIKLIHHRPTGGAYGAWSNWTKNGLANYIVGYHPLFMFLKCVRRFCQKPYGIAGAGLLTGYVRGYLKRIPQVEDREAIQFLRKQQMNYLFGRKSLWNGE
jgi:biofilm PGA synthesis N-glycosyltransferase PgaC